MNVQKDFQLFGPVHQVTLFIIAAIAFLLVITARMQIFKNWTRPISWTLAIVLIGNELIWWIIGLNSGLFSLRWGLPIQICDLVIFLTAYSLIKHRQWVWELAYFWGLGGTLQAVLTPDLHHNFPHYYFFKFFVTHGGVVVSVIFLAAGLGRSVTLNSVWRVWIITNVYAFLIGVVNVLFNANYLYLCEKPSRLSLLDHLGPWPFYLLGLEGVLLLTLFVYYAPFYLKNRINN